MDRAEIYEEIREELIKIADKYTYTLMSGDNMNKLENEISYMLNEIGNKYNIKLESGGIFYINQKVIIGEPNVLELGNYISLHRWAIEEV